MIHVFKGDVIVKLSQTLLPTTKAIQFEGCCTFCLYRHNPLRATQTSMELNVKIVNPRPCSTEGKLHQAAPLRVFPQLLQMQRNTQFKTRWHVAEGIKASQTTGLKRPAPFSLVCPSLLGRPVAYSEAESKSQITAVSKHSCTMKKPKEKLAKRNTVLLSIF